MMKQTTRDDVEHLLKLLEETATDWRDIMIDGRPDDVDVAAAFAEVASLAGVALYLLYEKPEKDAADSDIPF